MKKQEIVVVGGGFGGIKSALELAKNPVFRVTLIANKPFFEYYPMMYHTASGGSKNVSAIPLGEIFKNKRIEIIIDEAKKLDRKNKTLKLKNGTTIKYNAIIFALGTVTNYFGIEGMKEYSYGIKSLSDTEKLKAHLHDNLVDALQRDERYIVIGGGPTGIEIAGALPGYIKQLRKQHGVRGRSKPKVELVEAAPRLMPRMPKSVSKILAKRLRSLGVKIHFKKPVQSESADTLLLDGKPIRTKTVIWTAGIKNNPFFQDNKFILSENGRVKVDQLMQAWPGVFVIGDNADTMYSGMAQTALHDAIYVTKNIKRHVQGKPPIEYKPKKPVYITPVGKNWAVVVWGKLHFYGKLGWMLRKTADWIGYRDIEPWWKATNRTMSDRLQENSCLTCATKINSLD